MIDPNVLRDQAVARALDDSGIMPGCNEDEVEAFLSALESQGYVVVRKAEPQEE
jgi:hypothetical protein